MKCVCHFIVFLTNALIQTGIDYRVNFINAKMN